MALIYGCGQKTKLDHQLNAEIGSSAQCCRDDCQGIVQGLKSTQYCHFFFIPVCTYGSESYVQCKVCGSAYTADSYREVLKQQTDQSNAQQDGTETSSS
jgi:hypothetical protein